MDNTYSRIYRQIGASSHTDNIREVNDYYATDPSAAKWLLELEPDLNNIWECACGGGHLARVFEKAKKLGKATDIIDRGYGSGEIDFLSCINWKWNGDIVTNPPYKNAVAFVQTALNSIETGRKVCMFLKLTFLEGKSRKEFFKLNPPKTIYASSSRIKCAINGNFENLGSSAIAYGWFVWEKGFKGDTRICWFN